MHGELINSETSQLESQSRTARYWNWLTERAKRKRACLTRKTKKGERLARPQPRLGKLWLHFDRKKFFREKKVKASFPFHMAWRVKKEAITNENPVVDSVFIDPERCADELPGNYQLNNKGGRSDLSLRIKTRVSEGSGKSPEDPFKGKEERKQP